MGGKGEQKKTQQGSCPNLRPWCVQLHHPPEEKGCRTLHTCSHSSKAIPTEQPQPKGQIPTDPGKAPASGYKGIFIFYYDIQEILLPP